MLTRLNPIQTAPSVLPSYDNGFANTWGHTDVEFHLQLSRIQGRSQKNYRLLLPAFKLQKMCRVFQKKIINYFFAKYENSSTEYHHLQRYTR